MIKEIVKKIDKLQSGEGIEGVRKVKELTEKLGEIWKREEKYWYQRFRIKWLNYGDKNTKFFHQSTIQRRRQNKVVRVKGEEGEWIEEEGRIIEKFQNFYKKLFTEGEMKDCREVLENVPRMVTAEMNERLVKEVNENEIRTLVFELGAVKAPGPDRFNRVFYQKYWEIVKESVVQAVNGFFHRGFMLRELNKTNIVLIPKVKAPENVTQFRPISCCNFAYKIISKVLVNRLKPIMEDLITQN